MVSERAVGAILVAAFAIIAIVFTLVLWAPVVDQYALLAVKIVVWILVIGVSAIAIWLGWVMVSTKPVIPEEKPAEVPVMGDKAETQQSESQQPQ
jgi:uncharacterized membrane protein